jgi:biopolymer transport protein ExbD
MGAKLSGSAGGKFGLGQNAEINVTPFVDVMLVLLIIFMVAAPMATVSIKVDLPPPVDGPKPKIDPILINVQPYGRVYIGTTETSLATISQDVGKLISGRNPAEERLMLRADRGVKYGEFVGVLNTLQSGGFLKVALVSEAL